MTAGYYFYANVIAVAISGLAQAGRAVIGIVFLNRTNVNHSSCGAECGLCRVHHHLHYPRGNE